jgi:hypothetical protein
MRLDFSHPWRIVAEGDRGGLPDAEAAPAAFAADELAAFILGVGGAAPIREEGAGGTPPIREGAAHRAAADADAIVLRLRGTGQGVRGSEPQASPAPQVGASRRTGTAQRRPPAYSWRASEMRVEIEGQTGRALLAGVEDLLEALGARWVEPGSRGERLPRGPSVELPRASSSSPEPGTPSATLILGHGCLAGDIEDWLLWAARNGYGSAFIHTTGDELAFGAIPAGVYEARRGAIAETARRLGLDLELGGHLLRSFLPGSLFGREPGLFRMKEGKRRPDGNFCVSEPRALDAVSAAFASFALGHPEVGVFHVWPEDLFDGGWCSCPACSGLTPAAQSLAAARALSSALAGVRPEARLSFLAYYDTEDMAGALGAATAVGGTAGVETAVETGLPANLELVWAPRLRCWAHGLGDARCAINAASAAAFSKTAAAWRERGGGRVTVFEYYEDAVLFKTAVPPLSGTMAGDAAVYARGADAIGVLVTGGRRALAPRPNQWLLPRLGRGDEVPLEDWAAAAYGSAAAPMLAYWRALEAAWRIDLELEPGDSAVSTPRTRRAIPREPPADWGDPWTASAERLGLRRGRCEELFDRLREAEAALAEARSAAAEARPEEPREVRAVEGEALEYAIAGSLLEANCARLAVYHERACGQVRAAADLALVARAALGGLYRALKALPDRRSRREMRLLILYYYEIRLRFLRTEAFPLLRATSPILSIAELALRAASQRRAWELRTPRWKLPARWD